MRRSSPFARVITIVITVILTPVALALLSVGGITMSTVLLAYGTTDDFSPVFGAVMVQTLAVILLLLVVLTGIWSSAGLIVIGALGVIPLVVTLFPALLASLYRVFPIGWLDGAVYGLPVTLVPALGILGLVLARVRRHPQPTGAAGTVIGLIAAPVLLAGGGYLLTWGVATGTLRSFQYFEFDIQPIPGLAVLGGVVLLCAGVATTLWSRFALVLPAVALIAGSILATFAPAALFPLWAALPPGVNSVAPNLLLYGGGVSAAVIYLTFTAVLLRVQQQARLVPLGAPDATTAAPALPYPSVTGPSYPPQAPPPPPYGP